MIIDLNPYFERNEALLTQADGAFERVRREHPDCVACRVECCDCCHAIFDVTLLEALYLHHHFSLQVSDDKKASILEAANLADRSLYRLKRKAHKEMERGKNGSEILEEMAEQRSRCPLLNGENRCEMYAHRPITCRFYGIPTAIGGKGHTCGLSGFVKGRPYPTANLDVVHRKLFEISGEIARRINPRRTELGGILVPVSTALLLEFDEDFFEIGKEEETR